jgi:hypothetical protein
MDRMSARGRTAAIALGCVAALLLITIVVLLSVLLPRRARTQKHSHAQLLKSSVRRKLRLRDASGEPVALGPWATTGPYTPTCAPVALKYPAQTQIYATWYGVQTTGVVTIDMWKQNAADVLHYLNSSTIAWSGILIHIEPPASQTDSKPPNAYVYVDEIANFIAQIPITLRVGLQATVEQDSVWDLPFGQSKYARAAQFNDKFGYWADAAAAKNNSCTVATQDVDCGADAYCDVNLAQGTTIPARCIPKSLYMQCCNDEPGGACKDPKVPAPSTTYVPGPDNVFCSADVQGTEPGRVQGPDDCWCISELTTTSGAIVRGCAPPWSPASGGATSACQAKAASGTGGTGSVGLPSFAPDGIHYQPVGGKYTTWDTPCDKNNPCTAPGTTCWNAACVPSEVATTCGSDMCSQPDGTQFQQGNSVTGLWCYDKKNTDPSHTPMLKDDEMISGYHHGTTTPWCYCIGYPNAPKDTEPNTEAEKAQNRRVSAADASPYVCAATTSATPPTTRESAAASKFRTFWGLGASASANTGVINGGSCDASTLPDAGDWKPAPAAGAALPAGIPAPDTVTWFGGAGMPAAASDVDTAGSPYMEPTNTDASTPNSAPNGACPYKTDTQPTGCPNNMYHLGWYTALLNAILRERGSNQRVSMMNWDAEGNGPTGVRCSIFQFLYAIRQFGAAEDVLPTVWDPTQCKMVPSKWLLFQNGGSGLTVATAMSPGSTDPCNDWFDVDINLNPKWAAQVADGKFGDMVQFVPAPEYYWFGGEDMGGVANGGPVKPASGLPVVQSGLWQALADAGYIGCPQSAVKMGYDANCGCRQTVYDTYARVDDGGTELLDLLQPLYAKSAQKGTAPTFSIEHVGSGESGVNFGLCINSTNFDSRLADSTDPARKNFSTVGCAAADKCAPRCGVANFFGNWTEACFQQFLYSFANTYYDAIEDGNGIARLMVYDLGFAPAAWFDAAYAKSRNGFQPSIVATGGDPNGSSVEDYNNAIANTLGIEYNEVCPRNSSELKLYNCPDGPPQPGGAGPFWQHAQPGMPGNPTSGKLACYDCTKGCDFQSGGVGIPTLTTYADQNACTNDMATNASCKAPPNPPTPTAPTLSNFSNITMALNAAPVPITPPTSTSKGAFTYSIDNAAVATLNVDAQSGAVTVKPIVAGTANITATQAPTSTYATGSISATLTVTGSTPNPPTPTTPTLSNFSNITMALTAAPVALTAPTSTSAGAFTYSIDNAAVATLNVDAQSGAVTVKPIVAGTANITATQAPTSTYATGSISATLTVTGSSPNAPTLTGFSDITTIVGAAPIPLTPPTSTSAGAFTYSIDNAAVATLNVDAQSGAVTVKPIVAGTANITATQAPAGAYVAGSITAKLTVNPPTPKITNFSDRTIKLRKGATSFTLAPKSTSAAAFSFQSSNPQVAQVGATSGVVTVNGAGTTTLTVTQGPAGTFGAGSASATLTVTSPSPSPPSPPNHSTTRPLTREPLFIATIASAAMLLVLVICIAVLCAKRV